MKEFKSYVDAKHYAREVSLGGWAGIKRKKSGVYIVVEAEACAPGYYVSEFIDGYEV